MKTAPTPKKLGYRMPAEWEEHEATWLSWPNKRLPYWGKRLSDVEDIYVKIVKGLHGSEKVHMQVFDVEMEKHIRKTLNKAKAPLEHIVFFECKNLDVWTRDHGPIFVKNDKKVAITHWAFNGWGEYNDLAQDTMVPARIHQLTGMPYFNAGLVLEGGSIEANGKGTLITTKQCLFNKNRNPYSQDIVEQTLKDYLGVKDIIWLNKGLHNDDTAGHVDNLVRFVSEKIVVYAREHDKKDRNYNALLENERILCQSGLSDAIALPMPGSVVVDGQRRAASYANFYIANKAVLVPIFGQKKLDDRALITLRISFPQREVIPIDCRALVASGGTIHCVTQQQPARSYSRSKHLLD